MIEKPGVRKSTLLRYFIGLQLFDSGEITAMGPL